MSCEPALADALRAVMPELRISAEGSAHSDALFAMLRPAAESGWTLQLQRAGGTVALTRTLAGAPAAWDAIAHASALIVERYLVEVHWTGSDAALAPLPRAPSEPAPPTPVADPPPAAPLAQVRSVSASVGPSVRLPVANLVAPGLALALQVQLGERAFAAVSAGGFDLERAPVVVEGRTMGELVARTLPVFASAGLCTRGAPEALSACAGASFGVLLLSGGATGGLFQKREETLVTPEAGAQVRVIQPLGRSLELSGDVRVGVPLSRVALAVGGTQVRLAVPTVGAEAGVRIGWRFFP